MIGQSVRIDVSRNQHHHKGTLTPHLWIEVPDETPIQSTPHLNIVWMKIKLSSAIGMMKIKNQKRDGRGAGPVTLYVRRRKNRYIKTQIIKNKNKNKNENKKQNKTKNGRGFFFSGTSQGTF